MCDCVTVASLSALGRVLARRQVADLFVSVSASTSVALLFFCAQLLQATLSTSPSKPWWSFRVSGMKSVLAFFDFTSFGVQCTNKNAQQFITNQYFLGIDILKNIGTGACFLSLKIIGKSEMSNFDSAILKSQKKNAQHSPLFMCENFER